MPYRMRDPNQVAAEFLADTQPYAVFIDNNLGSNREYLRKLCHALRPLNKIWSAAVSIDVTDDPTLIRAMALAGCTGVFVGFESLTDENLADAKKKTPKTADYARRVRMLHDNGIQVNGSFVLGFDHDRKDVFTRTADWIEEKGNDLHRAPYTTDVILSDGGVYDNLGLETAWKRHTTILAGDGGGHMTPEPSPHHDWARHSKRVLDLIDNQVRSLRKRQLIGAYQSRDRAALVPLHSC